MANITKSEGIEGARLSTEKPESGIETKEVHCQVFDICFRSKGWIKTDQAYRGIEIPKKYKFKCTGF